MDKTRSKKTVAVLGGTFDPPHFGHLWLAKTTLATGLVDEVWLMPNFSHPWREPIAKAQDRLAMCQFLENKKIRASKIEIKRKGKSYTIDTVRELKIRYHYDFFWLMGSDRLIDLNKWKRTRELLKETEFIVFPRMIKISSSKIRERVKKGQSISDLVPKEVEEYIRKHKLYC